MYYIGFAMNANMHYFFCEANKRHANNEKMTFVSGDPFVTNSEGAVRLLIFGEILQGIDRCTIKRNA